MSYSALYTTGFLMLLLGIASMWFAPGQGIFVLVSAWIIFNAADKKKSNKIYKENGNKEVL